MRKVFFKIYDSRLDWKDSSNGKIPDGAVVGSIDHCGDYQYICRQIVVKQKDGHWKDGHWREGKMVTVTYIGRINPRNKACYLPINGKVII